VVFGCGIMILEVVTLPRTGRPKVDKPKSVKYSIRLDEDMELQLEAYCKKRKVTKGEAIRQGIMKLLRGEN
jgi:hypothetical protein